MTTQTSAIEPDIDPGLAKAIAAVITAAGGPPARALVVDHLVEEIVSVVASLRLSVSQKMIMVCADLA